MAVINLAVMRHARDGDLACAGQHTAGSGATGDRLVARPADDSCQFARRPAAAVFPARGHQGGEGRGGLPHPTAKGDIDIFESVARMPSSVWRRSPACRCWSSDTAGIAPVPNNQRAPSMTCGCAGPSRTRSIRRPSPARWWAVTPSLIHGVLPPGVLGNDPTIPLGRPRSGARPRAAGRGRCRCRLTLGSVLCAVVEQATRWRWRSRASWRTPA